MGGVEAPPGDSFSYFSRGLRRKRSLETDKSEEGRRSCATPASDQHRFETLQIHSLVCQQKQLESYEGFSSFVETDEHGQNLDD
jgi:hypothetical protein